MAKIKINPEDRRFGKPFVPELPDPNPPDAKRDVYMGTLVGRIIETAYKRQRYDRTRYRPSHRFTWSNLARVTGLTRRAIKHYFVERDRPLDIQTLDRVMWAMKLSVLDLLDPSEIVSYLQSVESERIVGLRESVQRILDKANDAQYSTTSTDSTSQNAPESDEN